MHTSAVKHDAVSIWEALTPAEIKVARHAIEGRPYGLIAERLVISKRTIHGHIRSIFRKLGISSRHQLTALAFETDFRGWLVSRQGTDKENPER